MSSSVPSKRLHPPNRLPPGKGLTPWLASFLNSTIGSKILVALTGICLTGFVVVHMIGNLKIFGGPDAINSYARFLKDLGPLLWVARIGLLALVLLHLSLAIRLKLRSKSARPVPYQHPATIQASFASRTMLQTGLVILAFVLFHLAHFTFGAISTTTAHDTATNQSVETNYLNLIDAQGRHDVYSMVVAGFRNPIISILYILAQLALFTHLSHGVSSVFQSLGLNTPRFQPAIKTFGLTVAGVVAVANMAIVVAVWSGLVVPLESFVCLPRN